jgi:hypothetical protein
MTLSCQLPLTCAPVLPAKVYSGCSGRNEPTKGPVPESIEVGAASSNVVSLASAGQSVP